MTLATDLDSTELRRIFGAFPSGVVALAAEVDDEPVGMAASSFTSVSLDPPLVSVCVARSSSTWPVLREARHLGVNVLGAHQGEACLRLAGPAQDRFEGLTWRVGPDGAIAVNGTSAWFECSLEREVTAGDHDILVLRVLDTAVDHDVAPLVFHASRFRELVQP